MVSSQFRIFFSSASLLFQIIIFPNCLEAQRKGESGRYVYEDDIGHIRYCHYCDSVGLSTDVIDSQVTKCIEKNYPFNNKTDAEEQRKKWRPICNRGQLPSCPLLNKTEHGKWNCGLHFTEMESYYHEAEDGYIFPVYTQCNLSCNEGYHISKTYSIYCNESRSWNEDLKDISCEKIIDLIGDIDDYNLPTIIGLVFGCCAIIGVVTTVIVYSYYFSKGASYTTAGDEFSHGSEAASSSSDSDLKAEPVEHEEKDSLDMMTLEDETSSLMNTSHPVSRKKWEDMSKVSTSDKSKKKMGQLGNEMERCSQVNSDQPGPHVEINIETNSETSAKRKDLQEVDGVHVKMKESHSLYGQVNEGLHEEQAEVIELKISHNGDNDDKALNQIEERQNYETDLCQVFITRRDPGDGMEADDPDHEHQMNLKEETRKTNAMTDTSHFQLCAKGKIIDVGKDQIDSVVKTVGPREMDKPKATIPQKELELNVSVVKDNDMIQKLRKKKGVLTAGEEESHVVDEVSPDGNNPKVKVVYLGDEQGQERLIVQEYEDNKFLVLHGKRFFIIPKCQGTINRLHVCKDEGHYRGLQYGSYQFLHMVESAKAEDHGLYSWEIFVEGYSSPKYKGKLFILVHLDQHDFPSLSSLDNNLLSSPVWQSMNPKSLLDDNSLSSRDMPSGTSCPPVINQAGSGTSTGLHQQETGSATCPGAVAATQKFHTAVSRRQFNSEPCHCTQTVQSAWNDHSLKMEELIHRGENKSMPWTHLGSRVLEMEPWFLECLEWHLRGRVHDGPMKYILKQMVHDGKKIGHLVEHFATVQRYDLVNCIKAFHSCHYCKYFYKS